MRDNEGTIKGRWENAVFQKKTQEAEKKKKILNRPKGKQSTKMIQNDEQKKHNRKGFCFLFVYLFACFEGVEIVCLS